MPLLEQWSIISDARLPHLTEVQGVVYNHPVFSDGDYITTSPIKLAKGRMIVTSDLIYELGTIDPEYKEWYYKEVGRNINEKNPFKS